VTWLLVLNTDIPAFPGPEQILTYYTVLELGVVVPWRLRQEDWEFKVNLGYIVKPYLKIKEQTNKKGGEAEIKILTMERRWALK
jgi:hypothetical protein